MPLHDPVPTTSWFLRKPCVRPTRLQLGLTISEAEVLYWIAHGKSNHEVSIILSTTLDAVKKHVVNLVVKMGVETRLVAALQAAEILELKTVEPTKLRGIREGSAEGER